MYLVSAGPRGTFSLKKARCKGTAALSCSEVAIVSESSWTYEVHAGNADTIPGSGGAAKFVIMRSIVFQSETRIERSMRRYYCPRIHSHLLYPNKSLYRVAARLPIQYSSSSPTEAKRVASSGTKGLF